VYDKIIVPGNKHDFTIHVISLPQLEFAEALQNHFFVLCKSHEWLKTENPYDSRLSGTQNSIPGHHNPAWRSGSF